MFWDRVRETWLGLTWERPVGRKHTLAHRSKLDYSKDLSSETHSMYPLFYLTFETVQAFLFLFLTLHNISFPICGILCKANVH